MIDLHCHILPGIDDGARDMEMALQMGRIARDDGIRTIVCTPHITPGVFDNDAAIIHEGIRRLQQAFLEHGIDVQLLMGCDMHVSPLMPARLADGSWPSIAGTRYFLFEPPHHVLPPNITRLVRQLLQAGYVPVLTHPERLTWIAGHYHVIQELDEMGVAMQITAGALAGRFGRQARYWAERMLDEGRVDVIATDAHDVRHRPPLLSEGFEHAASRVGEEAARAMVLDNPRRMLRNEPLPRRQRATRATETTGRRGARGAAGKTGWMHWLRRKLG